MAADEQTSDTQEEPGEEQPEPLPTYSDDTETIERVLIQLKAAA